MKAFLLGIGMTALFLAGSYLIYLTGLRDDWFWDWILRLLN